jgi:hypothetical protein
MLRGLISGVACLVWLTNTACAQTPASPAQNLVQPDLTTNGPAGSYDKTKTRRTVYANGVEVDTTQSFHKRQTYESGHGQLRASTIIKSSGPTTIVKLPPQSAP